MVLEVGRRVIFWLPVLVPWTREAGPDPGEQREGARLRLLQLATDKWIEIIRPEARLNGLIYWHAPHLLDTARRNLFFEREGI